MKTTERPQDTPHEALNDVSDVLQQIAPYWRTIAGVVVVGITAIALFGFIANSRKAAEEADWASYFDAIGNNDAKALQELAQRSQGKVVPWAQQAAAQANLIEGSQSLYTDREQANAALQEAVTGFNAAVAGSESIGLLNQRSLWGLGQAHEELGELDKAKSTYQQLLDRWPDSALAGRAQQRITSLDSTETQDFYNWFFAQTPVVPPAAMGALPSENFNVPDEPDLTIPDVTIPGVGNLDVGSPASDDAAEISIDAATAPAEPSPDAVPDSSENRDSSIPDSLDAVDLEVDEVKIDGQESIDEILVDDPAEPVDVSPAP